MSAPALGRYRLAAFGVAADLECRTDPAANWISRRVPPNHFQMQVFFATKCITTNGITDATDDPYIYLYFSLSLPPPPPENDLLSKIHIIRCTCCKR